MRTSRPKLRGSDLPVKGVGVKIFEEFAGGSAYGRCSPRSSRRDLIKCSGREDELC